MKRKNSRDNGEVQSPELGDGSGEQAQGWGEG